MILSILIVLFTISNPLFESFKELSLKDELISQPKLIGNYVYLFFEKGISRLELGSFNIENFLEGNEYNISDSGIILEKSEEKLKIKSEKAESKNLKNFYDFKVKVKKTFTDENFIYAQSEDNLFYCMRKKDKKIIWKIKLPSEIMSTDSDRKRVYVMCGPDIIICLKRKGGDIIWWKSIKERCFPEIKLLNGNLLISHRGGIQFLEIKNGALKEKLDVSMNFSPVLWNDYLILFETNKILVYKAKR